jgi:hypothetical protein
VVEALHLTDGVVELVEISDEKFGSRRDKTEGMLSGINAAHFPTETNPVAALTSSSVRRAEGAARPFLKNAPSFRVPLVFFDHLLKGRKLATGPHS